MSHTPGPWKIGQFDKILTADGQILHVSGVSIPLAGWPEEQQREFEANARLIAAAPELLEALKACHLQMLQSNNQSEYAEEANQLAIAAIAKAEGRQ